MDEKEKNLRDEIAKRKRDNWYDVFFAIEALGMTEEIVSSSLRRHAEKLSHVKDLFVYEQEFTSIDKIRNPMKNVEEAYAQIVKIKFFVKDLATLLRVVLTYGPSSVEIMGPRKKDIDMGEIQDISNILAGLVHQFAAAGAGGIIITPEEKK
jgi:hypothetical protein